MGFFRRPIYPQIAAAALPELKSSPQEPPPLTSAAHKPPRIGCPALHPATVSPAITCLTHSEAWSRRFSRAARAELLVRGGPAGKSAGIFHGAGVAAGAKRPPRLPDMAGRMHWGGRLRWREWCSGAQGGGGPRRRREGRRGQSLRRQSWRSTTALLLHVNSSDQAIAGLPADTIGSQSMQIADRNGAGVPHCLFYRAPYQQPCV